MPRVRLILLVTVAMLAFAGNSLLCRVALRQAGMDAAGFTTIRLASGAAVLGLLAHARGGGGEPGRKGRGDWPSACALFAYAAGFSFAYVNLSVGTGALLLFGAVQATMIAHGLWTGERLRAVQSAGLVLALSGLVGLLLPGLSAPPLPGSLLMLGAGAAWGVYSLRGKGAGDPVQVTAGNFLRTLPFAVVLGMLALGQAAPSALGVGCAVASGALASGVGYAIWYAALPFLKTTHAATVQLGVPVLAASGGVFLLDEPVSWRLVLASAAVLGGIALVVLERRPVEGSGRPG